MLSAPAADPRASDIWSLGATLFHTAYARLPFEAPEAPADVEAQLRPRAPSKHSSKGLSPWLVAALRLAVLLRAGALAELRSSHGRVVAQWLAVIDAFTATAVAVDAGADEDADADAVVQGAGTACELAALPDEDSALAGCVVPRSQRLRRLLRLMLRCDPGLRPSADALMRDPDARAGFAAAAAAAEGVGLGSEPPTVRSPGLGLTATPAPLLAPVPTRAQTAPTATPPAAPVTPASAPAVPGAQGRAGRGGVSAASHHTASASLASPPHRAAASTPALAVPASLAVSMALVPAEGTVVPWSPAAAVEAVESNEESDGDARSSGGSRQRNASRERCSLAQGDSSGQDAHFEKGAPGLGPAVLGWVVAAIVALLWVLDRANRPVLLS
jgi:hypothetical protein